MRYLLAHLYGQAWNSQTQQMLIQMYDNKKLLVPYQKSLTQHHNKRNVQHRSNGKIINKIHINIEEMLSILTIFLQLLYN